MNFRSIIKKVLPLELFRRIEPYGHLAEAVIAQTVNGFPARNMNIIGVTGTDGKTTTSSLITQMLRHSGYKVAMLTTISVDYGDGAGELPNDSRLTTAGAMQLARTLKAIKRSGAQWLVLETTSHALAQHRNWGVPYTIAVMTNISHEHLDYHKTFQNYLAAKKMLFEQCNANHKGLRVGIINADDPQAGQFADVIANPLLYGVKKGTLKAAEIRVSTAGSRYTAAVGDQQWHIVTHLPGSFNVYNSLAAVGVGRAVGLTPKQVEQGIASLHSVEGRMNRIDAGQDFDVIVDYAHTPDSFSKIFQEVKPVVKGKIIAVFGSAGRRDIAKRAQQGEIAGKHAGIVIVTEEDDRDCDGQEIMHQIAEGAQTAGKAIGKDLFLIHSREAAVQKAVRMAKSDDMVLLLGKGHEKSILGNGPGGVGTEVKRPYDEVIVATEAIKALKK